MSLANPYLQYKQNSVQGARPGELTLMLYSGLVKNLKQAIEAIDNSDINTANSTLIRSQEIVAYLNQTLDQSFEISQKLSALYEFMVRRLIEANLKKDPEIIREVLGLAEELRDTWQQALTLARETSFQNG